MATEAFELRSADGTRLHAVRRPAPGEPVGLVSVCHGLGEHIGRYEHVFATLNEAGWTAWGLDLRGHGRSDGRRGHVMAWDDYVDDVASLHRAADEEGFGELPRVQLGHSMGGLVATHLALRGKHDLAGLALSGPLLGVAVDVPPLKAAAGRLLSRLLPRLTMANEIDSGLLSHDPEVVAAYDADPLVHSLVSTRWFTEMLSAIDEAHRRAPSLSLPTLVVQGTEDRLTDPEATRRWSEAVAGPVSAHFLEGDYHEVFNEVDREVPLGHLTGWLGRLG